MICENKNYICHPEMHFANENNSDKSMLKSQSLCKSNTDNLLMLINSILLTSILLKGCSPYRMHERSEEWHLSIIKNIECP